MGTRMHWRAMEVDDLAHVKALADIIHSAYPEDVFVFLERLQLYPAGSHVLVFEGIISGYCVAHPWYLGCPPALNQRLNSLPSDPDTFYLHDFALAVHMRGRNAGKPHIAALAKHASDMGLPSLSLTAVSGSVGFWQKNGFYIMDKFEKAKELVSYGADACYMVRQLPRSVDHPASRRKTGSLSSPNQ